MNNMYNQKKNNKLIIIILISVFVVISITAVIIILLSKNILKSDEERFFEYFIQNIDAMNKIVDTSKEEQYRKKLEDNSFNENTIIDFKYRNKDNKEDTLTAKIEGINNHEINSAYKDIKVNIEEENIMNVAYLKENKIYGIHFADVVNEFATLDTANDVSNVVKYFGMDKFLTVEKINEVNISDLLNLTEEEKQKIEQNYLSIILQELKKETYDTSTNVYKLNINASQLEKIYENILSQISNDEVILGKIEKIDNRLKDAGINLKTDLKTKFTNYINEKSNSIDIKSNMIVTVYEQNETTMKTVIEYNNKTYTIDLEKENTINIKITSDNENNIITVLKNDNGIEINFENSNQEKASILRNIEENDNKIKSICSIKYSNNKEIKDLELNLSREIEIGQAKNIPTSFEEKGKILLNDYQNIDRVFKELRSKLAKYLLNKKEKTDSILLEYVIEYNNKIEEEEKNEKENSRKKFNSKFELYEGENLDKDIISNLIDEAGKNMSYYKKINDNRIHIYIQEGKENTEVASEIKDILFNTQNQQGSGDGKKYKVRIHYDKNAKIDQILIEKIEEKQN